MPQPKCLSFLICALAALPSRALNTLSVRQPNVHGSFAGYIDEAQILVEPKVGFATTSIFLTYSDHGQFPGRDVEVVQLFDLPAGARVDDLWLWFRDSIMQARIYELPRAQFLYDSVTSFYRDPAFLKASLGQYELHVFPLASGGSRKVKITFESPISSGNGLTRIPLPLGLLRSNAAAVKPVRILMRDAAGSGTEPKVVGASQIPLDKVTDTLGYRYRSATIGDITGWQSLDLEYADSRGSSPAFRSDRPKPGSQVFSIGIDPGAFFGAQERKRGPVKSVIGLDLSGKYDLESASFPGRLESLLDGAFMDGDSVRLLAVGAGKSETFPVGGWMEFGSGSALRLAAEFKGGAVYAAKLEDPLPRVLMTDKGTNSNWYFQGLEDIAMLNRDYSHLQDALGHFGDADVIAAYGEGFEDHLDANAAAIVRDSLEPFFRRGGWFLTYIDKNRSGELLATSMIKGLVIPSGFQSSKLVPVPSSPVGRGFPASLRSETYNPILSSDAEVSVEMVDSLNRPVVISKRIGNGRLIVSGIWTATEQEGVKKQMSMALLGLQAFNRSSQLEALLDSVAGEAKRSKADRILIAGNSDAPYDTGKAAALARRFRAAAGSGVGRIDAINLLTGQNYIPTSSPYQGTAYLGSGLALKYLAASAGGVYYGANETTWPRILEGLTPDPGLVPISLEVSVSPVAKDWPVPFALAAGSGSGKSRFWVGAAGDGDSIQVSFKGRFQGIDSSYARTVSFPSGKDSSAFGSGLSALFAGEAISALLTRTPLDTSRIVALAMQNRIVTDFTALLALEPNDSIHFIRDPKDESAIGKPPTTALAQGKGDTLGLQASWSEGERGLRLSLFVPAGGDLELSAYDLAGRKLFAYRNRMPARGRYSIGDGSGPARTNGTRTLVVFARFRSGQPLHGRTEWIKVVRVSR